MLFHNILFLGPLYTAHLCSLVFLVIAFGFLNKYAKKSERPKLTLPQAVESDDAKVQSQRPPSTCQDNGR
jgi:hypothetical protein